jgi:RNA polymerase sigma-70 factor, ECF subfamily
MVPVLMCGGFSVPETDLAQMISKKFMEQYVSNQDMLYGYVVSLLPNRADADEVFQETSLILWKNRDSYDPERSFIAWSYGIVRNVVANYVRKNKNRGLTLNPEVFSEVAAARQRSGDALQHQSEAMHHCLERLPVKQRILLMNCYSGQDSTSQIAGEMGVTVNALYLRLSRLRKQLMDCIHHSLRSEGNI